MRLEAEAGQEAADESGGEAVGWEVVGLVGGEALHGWQDFGGGELEGGGQGLAGDEADPASRPGRRGRAMA